MFREITLFPVAESYFGNTNYDPFLSCPLFHAHAAVPLTGNPSANGLLPPTTVSMSVGLVS